MGRIEGVFNFAANFEVLQKSPLDARQLVGVYSDLTNHLTWVKCGSNWLYNGAIVVVSNDSDVSKNGIYWLCDALNYTNPNSWINVTQSIPINVINGLSLSDENVISLGGDLITGTTINGLGVHEFLFDDIGGFGVKTSGVTPTAFILESNGITFNHSDISITLDNEYGLQYDDNYRSRFNEFSLPDVGYVTGLTNNKLDINEFNEYTVSIEPIIDNAITGITCIGTGVIPYVEINDRNIIFNSIRGSGGTTVNKVDDSIIIYSTSGGGGEYVFDSNIYVSICQGKTFGKYQCGDVIPSLGKTVADVIKMALNEVLEPNVTLTSTFSNVQFGLETKEITLSFSYGVRTADAVILSTLLEWRRGNSGDWNVLTSSIDDSYYEQTINEIDRFNAQPFNYRYTATDTKGGTKTITYTLTPQAYSAPSTNISLNGTVSPPQTQTSRERGNVVSSLSGSISSNRNLVNITDWCLERCYNGSSWCTLASCDNICVQSVNISSVDDTTIPNNVSSIVYRITYTDEYTNGSGGNQTISFRDYSYWGFNTNIVVDSGQIIGLNNREFKNNQCLTWNNINSPSSNYTYYAYPNNFNDITTITKNGVESDLGAWLKLSEVSVTNLYNVSVNYKVYKTNATQAYGASDCIVIT